MIRPSFADYLRWRQGEHPLLELKPPTRSVPGIMLEAIEGGVRGGLRKADKWGMFEAAEVLPEDELVQLITGYVMGNIEEEFDLGEEE